MNVDELMSKAFDPRTCRDPRSEEYMRGAIAALQYRIHSATMRNPYQAGTAQSDAWHAGAAEGHRIWREAVEAAKQAGEIPLPATKVCEKCGVLMRLMRVENGMRIENPTRYWHPVPCRERAKREES